MMYIFDTNILIHFVRESPLKQVVEHEFAPFSYENEAWVSAVVLGEIRSIAMQNKWGEKRLKRLNDFLVEFLVLDLDIESLHQRYAEIDAFSQGKHPNPNFQFLRPEHGQKRFMDCLHRLTFGSHLSDNGQRLRPLEWRVFKAGKNSISNGESLEKYVTSLSTGDMISSRPTSPL